MTPECERCDQILTAVIDGTIRRWQVAMIVAATDHMASHLPDTPGDDGR